MQNEANWGLGAAGWLLVVPGALFLVGYVVLRCRGTLCVASTGWHAGSVRIGRRVLLSALRLFALYQPLMRHEARLRRWLGGEKRARRDAVSEVVVELVSIG